MEENILTGVGRIRRKTYWTRWLIIFLIQIGIAVVMPEMVGSGIIMLFISLLLSIFIILQGVKRIHDTDNSGWFILVPIYNLILMLTDGTEGPNRFGEDPKERPGPGTVKHEDGSIALESGLYPESSSQQGKLVNAIFAIVITDVAIICFWSLINLYATASGSYEIYTAFSMLITPLSILTTVLIPILGAVYTPNKKHKTIFIICAVVIGLYKIVQETGLLTFNSDFQF